MPRFTDKNGVVWDIRTTVTTITPGKSSGSFFAVVADDSPRDYSAHLVDSDFEPLGHPGERTVHPAGGNPFLSGPGGEREAQVAANRLATLDAGKPQNQRDLTIKVTASAPTTAGSGSLVALLLVVAVIYFADGKGR